MFKLHYMPNIGQQPSKFTQQLMSKECREQHPSKNLRNSLVQSELTYTEAV